MRFNFCPRCATRLEWRPSPPPDPDRPTCPACGFVHYGNPAPTVQAWIEWQGVFLALRRDQDPLRGEWNLPGGFVEAGEGGPEAIEREVREETGLVIEVNDLIGIFPSTYGEGEGALPIFDVAFRCRLANNGLSHGRSDDREAPDPSQAAPSLEVSAESSQARWFTLADFPRPAFTGERLALAALRKRT